MRHAVFLPPFDDFADPRRLVDLAIAVGDIMKAVSAGPAARARLAAPR